MNWVSTKASDKGTMIQRVENYKNDSVELESAGAGFAQANSAYTVISTAYIKISASDVAQQDVKFVVEAGTFPEKERIKRLNSKEASFTLVNSAAF